MFNRCSRLNLKALAYLWRRDQAELLQEMIDCHIDAIIIKVLIHIQCIFIIFGDKKLTIIFLFIF